MGFKINAITISAADKPAIIDTFMRNIIQRDNGCWDWIGEKGRYNAPIFRAASDSASLSAHRMAFFLMRDADINGVLLTQRCSTKHCVNPFHYERKEGQESIVWPKALKEKEKKGKRVAAEEEETVGLEQSKLPEIARCIELGADLIQLATIFKVSVPKLTSMLAGYKNRLAAYENGE